MLNRRLIPGLLDLDSKITGLSSSPVCGSKAGVITEVVRSHYQCKQPCATWEAL